MAESAILFRPAPGAATLPQRARAASIPMECRVAPHGARRNGDGGYRVALDFHPDDQPDLLLSAPAGTVFLMVVVRLDDDGHPCPPDVPITIGRPGQNYGEMKPAAQVGMRCRTADFRAFLTALCNEPILSSEDASDAVCLHCHVDRKRQITAGSEAARLWAQLDADFRHWTLKGELP